MELHAARFSNSLSSPSLLENIESPADIGARWDIYRGGLERFEVTVKCRDRYEVYERRGNHLGQRMALYDDRVNGCISGFIYEIIPIGDYAVTYVVLGPNRRANSRLVTAIYSNTAQVDNTIKSILTNYVEVADSNQNYIASNTTTLGGWQTRLPQGTHALDAIRELVDKSDSGSNVYDFWFKDQPLQGTTLGLWLPYYEARSNAASVDFRVKLADLRGGAYPSSDIYDLATDVSVYYGTLSFTANGGSDTTATRASGSFVTDGYKPGDRFTNITDGSRATITAVAATTLTLDGLSGGSGNTVTSGDVCAVQLEKLKSSATNSGTPEYWQVDTAVSELGMDATQAAQYGAALLQLGGGNKLNSFAIGVRTIENGLGANVPIWEPLFNGGGYIQITDLFPSATLFDSSSDDQTFFITALDYKQEDNLLRVTVDAPDARLDARLQRAQIIEGQGVFV